MDEINESFLKNLKFTKETNFEILKSYFQKMSPKIDKSFMKQQQQQQPKEDINNNELDQHGQTTSI